MSSSSIRVLFVRSATLCSIALLTACFGQQHEDSESVSPNESTALALLSAGGERESTEAPAAASDSGNAPKRERADEREGELRSQVSSAVVLADAGNRSNCPDDMVEVQGEFCPSALEECLRWLDKDHTNRLGTVDPNMCAEFRYPTTCLSTKRVSMHFCVDRYEWPNRKGEIPDTRMSWVQAKGACESVGKRLCADDEWTFACEGPDMKPYPYGDGYHRDSDACNADHTRWIDPFTHPFEELDHRAASGAYENCHSDWGVYDIVGNADEWVFNTKGNPRHQPWVSGLMGGHWVHGVRNRCRAITDSHEPQFSFYVTGARCCSDPTSEDR